MVPKSLVMEEKWDAVSQLCKEAVHAVHGFAFAHLGINQKDVAEATTTSMWLEHILKPMWEKPTSFFTSEYVEVMKGTNLGTHGHIGIHTYDVRRALNYLSFFGFESVQGTERWDDEGTLNFIYLSPEIGGFALHLMRV